MPGLFGSIKGFLGWSSAIPFSNSKKAFGFGGSGQAWPAPEPIGNLFTDPFDSNQWVTVGNPFVTFASDGITFNGSPGGVSDYIYYKGYTDLDNARFGFTAILTNTSYIIFGFIGRCQNISKGIAFELEPGTGKANLYGITNQAGATPTFTASVWGNHNQVQAVSGTLICWIEKDASNARISSSLNGAAFTTTTVDTQVYNRLSTMWQANMGTVFLMNVACDCKFTNVYLSTNENKNGVRGSAGHSVPKGCFAESDAGRWSVLIGADINAGGGETTLDVLNRIDELLLKNFQKLFLQIGLNDEAASINVSVWGPRYQSIVSQLEAAGTSVVHILQAGFGAYGIAVNNFIIANYPTSYIDCATPLESSPGVMNVLYNSGDDHPNAAGHALIASTILASQLY